MNQGQSTSVPKRALARLISNCAETDELREYFHIGIDTDITRRLEDFKKSQLIEFLLANPHRATELEHLERKYPLSGAPTLYLVRIINRPSYDEIIQRTQVAADEERAGGRLFDDTRAVRVVYVSLSAFQVAGHDDILEIPISYERRFEYNVGDPESELYGQRIVTYSLEQGFAWIIEKYDHSVVCCGDYVAIRPILQFFAERLHIRAHLPDLSDQMIEQLSAGANPRSVTYSSYQVSEHDQLDIQTLTMSDPHLSERSAYTGVQGNPDRYQTAGFYRNHPGLLFGGIGISRRYGRIWTPVHVTRGQLTILSADLIERTEKELKLERERNPSSFVRYHRHLPVKVNEHQLQGKARDAFDGLAQLLLQAQQDPARETEVPINLQSKLINNQGQLSLDVTLVGECPNCGQVLFRCPGCDNPYRVELQDETVMVKCPTCNTSQSEPEELQCGCGQVIPIVSIRNHITFYPDQLLLDSVETFLGELGDPAFRFWFCISGQRLKLLPLKNPPAISRVRLGDLTQWRTAAHHHLRGTPTGRQLKIIKQVLNAAREKCPIRNYHPRQTDCNLCLTKPLKLEEMKAGQICLPRILGYAIGKRFDGIHHGGKIADVKYQDGIEGGDGIKRDVNLGIHLKSRTYHRKHGLGRSVECIKGLYTQLFYSVHQVLVGEIGFDIVGISVPNTINADVVGSMQSLVNKLGLPLLVIDEGDWLKIVDCVIEGLKFG